jgi:hypothetical protein
VPNDPGHRREHPTGTTTPAGCPGRSSWQVPLALLVLSLIPVIAGSLRLLEIAGGSCRRMGHPMPVRTPGPSCPPGGSRPRSVGGVAMNQPPGTHAPADYEIRIEGHFDEYWSAWFGGLTLIREDEGTTTLRGAVTDQAQLHGLLAKVRDLGTTLISVKAIETPGRR